MTDFWTLIQISLLFSILHPLSKSKSAEVGAWIFSLLAVAKLVVELLQ